MKIVAPLDTNSKTASISSRFARASYFAIIDTETGDINIVNNPFVTAPHGAGTQATNWAIQQGATAIIADQLGPYAQQAINSNPNLKAFMSGGLTVDKIADAYKNGELTDYNGTLSTPMGVGYGRGMGLGLRRGTATNIPWDADWPPAWRPGWGAGRGFGSGRGFGRGRGRRGGRGRGRGWW